MDLPPLAPLAIVYPWSPHQAVWDELRYSLRSLDRHFADRACPIYLLADRAPDWLEPGGRVIHLPARRYQDALALGVQLAEELLWMNDDICLLQECGWETFAQPHRQWEMSREKRDDWFYDSNGWKRGMARALDALEHHGKGSVNAETHLPYRWKKAGCLEILETYGCYSKMPLATYWVNHFAVETRPVEGFRTSDALSATATVLNYVDSQVTETFKTALAQRFPLAAPWEKAA